MEQTPDRQTDRRTEWRDITQNRVGVLKSRIPAHCRRKATAVGNWVELRRVTWRRVVDLQRRRPALVHSRLTMTDHLAAVWRRCRYLSRTPAATTNCPIAGSRSAPVDWTQTTTENTFISTRLSDDLSLGAFVCLYAHRIHFTVVHAHS